MFTMGWKLQHPKHEHNLLEKQTNNATKLIPSAPDLHSKQSVSLTHICGGHPVFKGKACINKNNNPDDLLSEIALQTA